MRIVFVSLGCDKNLVDSERMITMLADRGHTITPDETEAEAAIVNTCCFINDAKQESINTLLEMAELKNSGSLKVIIAAGCLAQRYQKEILKEIPEVDAIVGTTAFDRIADALDAALSGKAENYLDDIDKMPAYDTERRLTTGGLYAHLKIAEGCDKHCTYCIIPKVRGKYRSVPMESLVEEAGKLAESGVKELILVAQETTLYGVDLYGKKSLPELLHRLCRIEGIRWIRIMYCYPEEITDELIETIKSEEKICHYLDIPIQHVSDDILKRMGRLATKQSITDIIAKLRREIPDICLRTTLIVGFPGETKEHQKCLMDFVKETRFERLGVFPYSPEEGTPAAKLPNKVRRSTKENRQFAIWSEQVKIASENSSKLHGSVLTVMIEEKMENMKNTYAARSYMDAPEVDGIVYVRTAQELHRGDFVDVEVCDSFIYDLRAKLCKKRAKQRKRES